MNERASSADGGVSDLLRFATAGSVDDGKSTLVGRLLYDTKSVLADQIEAVHRASVDKGLSTPDLSLLVDGLRAEREQGITIDVAYRYFATPRREFVLADTPGHVQYTRNTVTGASTAELAVLLIDARSGVVEQTRRHAAVLALLRVPRVVLAINKIDLVDYDEAILTAIAKDFAGLAKSLGITDVTTIPVSALLGDNVVERSPAHPLVRRAHAAAPPRVRAGRRARGERAVPDAGAVRHPRAAAPTTAATRGGSRRAPSRPATRSSCCPAERRPPSPRSTPPTGRCPPRARAAASPCGWPTTSTSPAATSSPRPMRRPPSPPSWTPRCAGCRTSPCAPGARLLVKHGTRSTQAIVGPLGERLDTDTVTWVDAPGQLAINDIARVTLRTADPLPVDDYAAIRATGSFLLIDPPTGNTLAAGLIGSPLH